MKESLKVTLVKYFEFLFRNAQKTYVKNFFVMKYCYTFTAFLEGFKIICL